MTCQDDRDEFSRREFVKVGITAAAIASWPLTALGDEQDQEKGEKDKKEKKSRKRRSKKAMPTRVLGRTGQKVPILGTGSAATNGDRMLGAVYDAGIRYMDTADCYAKGKHERELGAWVNKKGCRKEVFIVTKDHPNTPDEFVEMADKRLENLQSDYIDLFFIHGIGEPKAGFKMDLKQMYEVPKSKEWAQAAEKLKKSGKVRFVGFSLHGEMSPRIEILNNAASGGWTDAVMLMYDPQTVRENAEFNKALDACHKAGIGLVTMKHHRRLVELKDEDRQAEEAAKIMPDFADAGLNPWQAVLQAVWTDERIAVVCSGMQNMTALEENVAAARKFKPLNKEKMAAVIGLLDRCGRRSCNACDGRCRRAAATTAALNSIVRYLNYFEADGNREEARRLFAALSPAERDWHNADLKAASCACRSKLDFPSLLARAEQKLA
jgi:hypothetical protein